MNLNFNEILSLLPHQPPFRFVDEVTRYMPGCLIQAQFSPILLQDQYGIVSEIPETILIEGLAQTAVLLTQLETKPLKDGEIPLLGSVNFTLLKQVEWQETLTYHVEIIRILEKQAVLKGKIFINNEAIVSGSLSVAVT